MMKTLFYIVIALTVGCFAIPKPMESIENYNVLMVHGAYGSNKGIDEKTGVEEDVGTVDGSLKMTKDVLMEKYYTLVNTRTEPFVSDTTINWTLIYVDQYGRKDSLAMKTVFKK